MSPQKLYIRYYSHIAARHMTKYCGATPTTDKVIEMHLLNFRPIFDPPFEKNCKGDPIPGGGALANLVIL